MDEHIFCGRTYIIKLKALKTPPKYDKKNEDIF